MRVVRYRALYSGDATQLRSAEEHLEPEHVGQDQDDIDVDEKMDVSEDDKEGNVHIYEEDTDEEDPEQLTGEEGGSQNAIPEGGSACAKGAWWDRIDDIGRGCSN